MTETNAPVTETAPPQDPPKLGRIAVKSDRRTLQFSQFLKAAPADLPAPPKRTKFWTGRAGFSIEDWGNIENGCCTIAKQANMFRRLERIERKRTITITTDEVLEKYYAMTEELYGGGDTGAYEEDALNRSRREETCLRDEGGRPLLIDAYIRLNPYDHVELKRAIATSGAHGIAVCLNLPAAFSSIRPPNDWDKPDDQSALGPWLPGSWGGHSMWAVEYDEIGLWLEHTWKIPLQRVTWEEAALYLDEAHIVIDSVNAWAKKKAFMNIFDLEAAVKAVNKVSSKKIAA